MGRIILLVIVAVVVSVMAASPSFAQGRPSCEQVGFFQVACVPNCPQQATNANALIASDRPGPGETFGECGVNPPANPNAY